MCDLCEEESVGREYGSGVKGVIRSVQVTRNVREGQALGADQLHWRTSEHPIVLFTHESCILNRLGRNIVHVGIRTNNSDVIRMRLEGIESDVCCTMSMRPLLTPNMAEEPTLANQEPNSDAGHVKSIQKPLDVVSDQPALILLFPFEDTPRHGRNGRVVPPLDLVEALCEPLVVVVHLGWPFNIGWVPIVPSVHGDAETRLVVRQECPI